MEKHDGHSFVRLQFSRSPVRSFQFWVNTFLLISVTWSALSVTARFWFYLNGMALVAMIFPLLAMSTLWFRLLRVHQRFHDAYDKSLPPDVDQKSATNLDDLAYLAYLSFPGFSVALVALFSANMAWAWALSAATSR